MQDAGIGLVEAKDSRVRTSQPPDPPPQFAPSPSPASPCASASTLVERFDIEPYSDFSAKWSNFTGLVLFCIDAKFCKKICVGKLLTRSTRFTCFCTVHISIFQKCFVKLFRNFRHFFQKFVFFEFFSVIFAQILMKFIGMSPHWQANILENVEIFWFFGFSSENSWINCKNFVWTSEVRILTELQSE